MLLSSRLQSQRKSRVNMSPDVSVQHHPFIQDRNNLSSSSSKGTSLNRTPGNTCFLIFLTQQPLGASPSLAAAFTSIDLTKTDTGPDDGSWRVFYLNKETVYQHVSAAALRISN